MVNPAIVDPVPGSNATMTPGNAGADPPPKMVVGLLPAPALTSHMSSPAEVHASVGDEWSHKLRAAEIVIDGAASLTRRSFCVLQEITFPPALPAEPAPRWAPAT